MGYIDLIPDVFRLTMPDLATGKSYHTQKFNVGNKQCIGVTIKASQALSVAVAYGIATDTAAAAGVDIAASLPYKTSATSFASNTSTEGGTYHEIAVPPHARQAQLVISNASGSTVSGAVIDAALRVVAYPAASGSGSSDFASITGWPGSSSQFVHADGSYSPLSAADMPTGIDAAKIGDGSVSTTEFQYINTLSSNAQTQISARLPLAGGTMTGDLVVPAANFKPSGSGGSGHFLKQTSSGGAISSGVLAAGDIPAPTFAGIVCSKTSDQAVAANTATDVTFTIERVSESAHLSHSTSSSPAEITVNTAGKYRISGRLCVDSTSGSGYDHYYVYLLKNGTIIAQARFQGYQPAIAPATTPGTFDWAYDLAQNDVIKLQAFAVNNGFNVAGLTSSRDQTFLSMVFLGV